MKFEHSEARRVAFQKRMAETFHKLVNASSEPDQFANWHIEFYYSQDLNFGRFFRHNRVRLVGMERAYLEAVDNMENDKRRTGLVVSRPHDNYYLLHAAPPYVPIFSHPHISWTIKDLNGDHDVVLQNLKAVLRD